MKDYRLKPCPFCGKEPEIFESKIYCGIFGVSCICGCNVDMGDDEYGFTFEQCIERWNSRV